MSLTDDNDYLQQDDWPEEDFMNTLLKMDDAMLFNEPPPNGHGGSDDLDDIMRHLNYGYPAEQPYLGEQPVTSPLSSHASSDQDFHGFPSTTDGSSRGSLDGYFDEGYGVRMRDSPDMDMKPELMNVDFGMMNVLDPGSPITQEAISSAASDSGLSSDHLDLDPNTEYEALSPGLSSPGPSISERGGQNSPPRYVKSLPMQPTSTLPSSNPSSAPIAPQTVVQVPMTVGQRVAHAPAAVRPEQKAVAKPIATSTISMKATPKVATATTTVKAVIGGNGPKRITSIVQGNSQQLVGNGKELKIIRMATMKNGQTVAVTNGLANGASLNKKVTLQLKNSATTPKTVGAGTVLPKNVVLTSAGSGTGTAVGGGVPGVRKIIRMQQQSQQNGRPILVPVTIQDLRTIKIVNSTNLKNKTANIQLAAANMLQKSKQGLLQNHVVLSKDQLMVDDALSDAGPSSSDSESYVFEDIMQQSNSVIAEVERQQKHLVSDSDVEPDGDDGDDDDIDMDDIGKGRNRNGTYQKLMLTAEEKRLLAKEGISLPTSYPLTKHEERELKRIRRKIRNKISAQDSRKRKKEYVDGLEERVKQCTEENQNLVKRIKILQSQNHDLISQMKRIQSLLTKGTSKTTQPATCLMVLLISMALVAVPNLKLGNTATQQNIQDSVELAERMQDPANDKLQVQQSRRSLLFDTKDTATHGANDEELNFDEIMSAFNVNSLIANEHDYFGEADGRNGPMSYEQPSAAKRPKLSTTTLIDYDVDDEVWNGAGKIRIKQEDGSMSPDSSSSSGGHKDLFEQKVREFQAALQRSVESDRMLADQYSHREVIVDRDLLDLVGKKEDGLYELNLDTFSSLHPKSLDGTAGIDLLGVGLEAPSVVSADSTGTDPAGDRKLNASQQIQQQNNKRKLLL